MNPTKAWCEEEDATLSRLWGNETAGAIAKVMGRSRNSIIGRAHRLALKAKGKPTEARPAPPKPAPAPAPPKSPKHSGGAFSFGHDKAENRTPPEYIPPTQIWSGSGVPFMEAKYGQCRAVMGSSADPNGLAIFCGEPIKDGTRFSFCKSHHSKFTYRMR